MTGLDLQQFALDLALQTKAAIAGAVAPGHARIQALEDELAVLRKQAPSVGPVGPPGADGRPGMDGKDADPAHVRAAVLTELQAMLREIVREEVARAVASTPQPRDGRDGKDADLLSVKTLVDAAVAGVQLPDVGTLVKSAVVAAMATIPVPQDGRNGVDGKDGLPGKDGIDGKDGLDGAAGKDGLDGVAGKDGLDGAAGKDGLDGVAGKDGLDGVNGTDGIDGKAGVAGKDGLPGLNGTDGVPGMDGKDGAGLTGAFIDRDGHLILTVSDGGTKNCGVVVGKSVDMADVARSVAAELATWARPADGAPGLDGKDGLGFDDLSVGFDETTGYVLRFTKGDEVKDFRIAVPWYAGVWQAGTRYPKGAMVTHKKHEWTAKADTFARPATSMEWQLSAQGGRDGKDAPGARHE